MSFSHNSINELRVNSEILNILRELSRNVTEFTKKVCWELNLDRDVKVNMSLRVFTEPDWESVSEDLKKEMEEAREDVKRKIRKMFQVYGYYDPRRKTIVLSLPCVRDNTSFSLTLAHELIHHCQSTCRSKACRDICEYWLSPEEFSEIREMLPYKERPYEVEAYSKDEKLAKKIKSVEGFKEIVQQVRRVYAEIKILIA